MDKIQELFQPFRLKSLELKNRIVMAPMTRSFSPGGVPASNVADYYVRRAKDEVGLIVSEGTVVNRPASSNDPDIPHFYGEKPLSGWKAVIDRVHAAGGLMAPQLWHMGVVAPKDTGWLPPAPFEGPSGYVAPGKIGGVAMTESDIAGTIQAFAQAAAESRALGFDAVEIHGAHGYLIDQFFWHPTNQRTDRYGGRTLAERARFAVELVQAFARPSVLIFRSAFGSRNGSCRISQQGWRPRPGDGSMAGSIGGAGVDIFHCSQRRFWEPEFTGSDLNFAGWAKKLTGKSTITVGSIGLSGDFLKAFKENPRLLAHWMNSRVATTGEILTWWQ